MSFGERVVTWVCATNTHALKKLTEVTKLDNLSEFLSDCFRGFGCLG
jgi:hypothetical protein